MRTSVVVFAREPVPGTVKTRLAADIGDRAAALVYGALLDGVLATVNASGFDSVVSLAESPSKIWIERLGHRWEVQEGSDLGERMRDAFDRRFAENYDRVLVVGSDCPGLRPGHLLEAKKALDDRPVVLGPARDGGYWMVAQRRPGVDLFAGVPWSSPETLAATRRRLVALESPWTELEKLGDVDRVEDLRNVIADAALDSGLRRALKNALRT